MIPLIYIFEHIRKQKRYKRTQLLKSLGISSDSIRLQIRNKRMPNQDIPTWCSFLDIPIRDYEPLLQYNNRHELYHYLEIHWPRREINPFAIQLMNNLIFFEDKITDWGPLISAGLPVTLPHIQVMPYTIENALSDLKLLAEKGEAFTDDE